jgi:hypothetical protein
MKINKYLSGIAASAIVVSCATAVSANAMQANDGQFRASDTVQKSNKVTGLYIVQMKGAPAISKASQIGELLPSNQLVAIGGNNYNANTPKMRAYVETMKTRQAAVAKDIGVASVLYNYAHTFNGFSARLSPAQAAAMRNHPDVAAVYVDEVHQLQTANTPAFLGLTGPGGQHTLGIKGEDVVVGILDSGIWPENPSFGENSEIPEMTYGPAPDGWAGACNVGSVGAFDETAPVDEFTCNNKLIGARYFGSTFASVYDIQFGLGEFASPRDADGHGSHTASTAAGNAGVTAVILGNEVGTVSGIAPRARVAAYKVCWNANYSTPEGDDEAGCFFGDSMAAIDQAVVDGVDVLNYSIGNSLAINSPVYNAALKAAEAGVFFSASAGNSGPAANTVNNIAPWIATVAASTYDGTSAVFGNAIDINSGDLAATSLFAVPSVIGTPIPEGGLTADAALADPIFACEALASDLTGQIAVISRGGCPFTQKLNNAAAAGAIGAIVYTNAPGAPIAMGGDPVGIPGVMVSQADGATLSAAVESSTTNVTLTNRALATESTEVGNIMAGFSSRGQNLQTGNIIKPDITAPGVRILAATSPQQLMFGNRPQGENYAYLQGTSMSSPHIAGMGALLIGAYPDWTPAQVKSALMTTARQNVVKEDGSTPADAFDFGAGHADPGASMNPGVVYSTNFNDYLGFLCGQGEAGLVASLSETTCGDLAAAGFATEANQLNYPSMAIDGLLGSQTLSRTVTDVTGEAASYEVVVEAPAGIDVTVATFDAAGVETESALLEVDANGTASYSVTFTPAEGFTPETWLFGSLTLDGSNGISARSPIAVKAAAIVPPATIEVPESLVIDLNRGRGVTFVRTLYSGAFSVEHTGLAPLQTISGTTTNRNGAAFDFNTAANAGEFTLFAVPEGTSLLRVALANGLVTPEGANVDLHLWNCIAFNCNPVESSENVDSNENMIVLNPEPRSGAGGNVYVLLAHYSDPAGVESADFVAPTWIVGGAEANLRVGTSPRAVANRFQNISLRTRGLEAGQLYMGTMTFFDADGVNQGTSVIEVQP